MYHYIVDASATTLGRAHQDKIRARLDELGIGGEWSLARASGDAARLAASAATTATTVVAVGGDDTVNEVINGLGDAEIAVGIIPAGATNRLAGQLGLADWQQACQALAGRRLTAYNLIAAGQRYFLSTLTLGFEAELSGRSEQSPGTVRQVLAQIRRGYGQGRRYQGLRARLTLDNGLRLEGEVFALQIASQRFLDPSADNHLVVSLLDRPSRFGLGAYLWHLVRHQRSPIEETATSRFVARRVVIETVPQTGINIDGKAAGRTPIAIRLTERRLRFITAKNAPGRS